MAGVADTFRGLPMEDLIAAPLKAVCDSQKQLAKSTHEFMTQIGFDTDDKGNLTGPRLLEYQLERGPYALGMGVMRRWKKQG